MNHSVKTGFSFGLTSGIITTLGLMVGLQSGTGSRMVVLGGILTIAIADSFSDALGIHISEESEGKHTHSEIWMSTISTFLFKLVFASTFIVPVLLLDLDSAIIASLIWGLFMIVLVSVKLAHDQNEKIWKVAGEHILITGVVVVLTHYVGRWISTVFV